MKKDGSPMTSEAAEIMDKLKENEAEYEAVTSTDSSVNLEEIDNRIITDVLGPERYGRVRFQGSGVIPTQYFGSGSQQYMPSGGQSRVEVQRLKDQIAQMQESTIEQRQQIADIQRKYEELLQQLRADAKAAVAREAAAAAREAAIAAREAEAASMLVKQNRKYDELQLQLQHMMQMFQQSQKPPS